MPTSVYQQSNHMAGATVQRISARQVILRARMARPTAVKHGKLLATGGQIRARRPVAFVHLFDPVSAHVIHTTTSWRQRYFFFGTFPPAGI